MTSGGDQEWLNILNERRRLAGLQAKLAEAERQRLIKEKAKAQGSPLEQLAWSVGGAGLTALGERGIGYLGDKLFSSGSAGATTGTQQGTGFLSKLFGSSGSSTPSNVATNSGAVDSGLAGLSSAPTTSGLGDATATAIGQNADGTYIYANDLLGNSANAGATDLSSTLGTAAGIAAAAKGGYDTYNSYQHGGKGSRSALATTGAGLGMLAGGPIGAGIGAIMGSTLGYGLKHPRTGKGMLALAATAPAALLMGKNIFHETTAQKEQKRWQELKDRGITGTEPWFNPENAGKASTWKEGLGAGEKWNMETAIERAKIQPAEFRGVYGNFDVFGNDWMKYTTAQQDAIVRKLIDANLYESKKGDVIITDPEKAKQIRDEVLKK